MINQIYICTNDDDLLFALYETLSNVKIVEVLKMQESEYLHNLRFDIIHNYTYTTLDVFGGSPIYHESMVVETKGKYELPPYIVINPAFRTEDSDVEKLRLMIFAPLRKAIEFSTLNNSVKKYATHTHIFCEDKQLLLENLDYVKDELVKIVDTIFQL